MSASFRRRVTTTSWGFRPESTRQISRATFATNAGCRAETPRGRSDRSEEHTSELQSHLNIVCRLLLDKKRLAEDFTPDAYIDYIAMGGIAGRYDDVKAWVGPSLPICSHYSPLIAKSEIVLASRTTTER